MIDILTSTSCVNIMAMSIFVGILITTWWSLGIGRVDPIHFYPHQNQSLRLRVWF